MKDSSRRRRRRRRRGRGRTAATGAVLPVYLLLFAATALAQESGGTTLETEPEELVIETSPLSVVVQGLPELPAVPFEAPADPVFETAQLPADEPAPPTIPRETVGEVVDASAGDQVYFNATLGGGSVNSVLGSINVYRLGEGPQFRLGYDHRGADGFNLSAPGRGFFLQENRLETWIRVGDGQALQVEGEARYADHRFGLQRLPTYYSADRRELDGSVDLRYAAGERSALGFSLEVSDRQRVLAATAADADSPRETYRVVAPSVGTTLEWARFSLEAQGDWDGRFTSGSAMPSVSSAGLTLAVEGVPIDGLTLGATASTRYRFSDGAYFPAEASMEFRGAERWSARVEGGYRIQEPDPTVLWEEYVVSILADSDQDPWQLNESLFVTGSVEGVIVPGVLEATGRVNWSRNDHALVVGAYDDDPELAGYPVAPASFERLDGGAGIQVPVGANVDIGVDWTGRFRDRTMGTPEHEMALRIERRGERATASVAARLPIADDPVAPELGAELSYRIAENIDLRAYGSDLLGPVDDAGRTPRGLLPTESDPLIAPGFELGFAVRVRF